MVTFCGRTLDDALMAELWGYATREQIPLGLLAGLVAVESDGDPGNCGDLSIDPIDPRAFFCPRKGAWFCSWGLLQLNRCGGQGTGLTLEQLTDPAVNLEVGVPFIARAYRDYWSSTGDLWIVLRESGHPGGSAPTPSPAWAANVELVRCAIAELADWQPQPQPVELGDVAGVVWSTDGSPIPGAVVRLDPGALVTTAAAGGAYRFDELTPGTYAVSAAAAGHLASADQVLVLAGDVARLDLELTPALPPPPGLGAIAGFVIERTGRPVVDALVVTSPSGRQAVTNLLGGYRVDALEPGLYQVLAIAAGFLQQGRIVRVTAGATADGTLVLATSAPPGAETPGRGTVPLVAATLGLVALVAVVSVQRAPAVTKQIVKVSR